MCDILGEQHALELNDEEVDQLFDVFERGFESFAGNGVVFFRAEGGGKALGKGELAKDLSQGSSYNGVSKYSTGRISLAYRQAHSKAS